MRFCSAPTLHNTVHTNLKFANKNNSSAINFDLNNMHAAIKVFKPSASFDVDASHLFIQAAELNILTLRLKIFTISLEEDPYPETWTVTYVETEYKSGLLTSIKKYRPINITSVKAVVGSNFLQV